MSEQRTPLQSTHLMDLRLTVDAANAARIGPVSTGYRSIAPITGGTFEGERLRGEVLPGGADWVLTSADKVIWIDVRLTLKTQDDALIYLAYNGRLVGDDTALTDIARGKALTPDRYSLAIIAKFECGDDRYSWLNTVIAVGTGKQSGFNPVYSIHEIG